MPIKAFQNARDAHRSKILGVRISTKAKEQRLGRELRGIDAPLKAALSAASDARIARKEAFTALLAQKKLARGALSVHEQPWRAMFKGVYKGDSFKVQSKSGNVYSGKFIRFGEVPSRDMQSTEPTIIYEDAERGTTYLRLSKLAKRID